MPVNRPPNKGQVPPASSDQEIAPWVNQDAGGAGTYGAAAAAGRGNEVLKPGQKVGALGVAEHFGTYGRGRFAGATGEGQKVGVKGVAIEFDQFGPGAAAAPVTDPRPGNGIGVHGVSGAGTGVRGDSRTGVGVAGKSRSVAGVEGQSEFDVGGVFVSNSQAQVRLYPSLRELPASGRAGDLLALLGEHATLDVPTAELWFCVQSSSERGKAVWTRVAFGDGAPDS